MPHCAHPTPREKGKEVIFFFLFSFFKGQGAALILCYSLAFCSGAASEAAGLRLTADKREAAGSTTKWSTHQLEDSLPHHGQALAYAGGTRCSRASPTTGPVSCQLVLGRDSGWATPQGHVLSAWCWGGHWVGVRQALAPARCLSGPSH